MRDGSLYAADHYPGWRQLVGGGSAGQLRVMQSICQHDHDYRYWQYQRILQGDGSRGIDRFTIRPDHPATQRNTNSYAGDGLHPSGN